MRASAILLILALASLLKVTSQACDPGCKTCGAYCIGTPTLCLFLFYQCDQCSPNHILNTTTGICDCQSGYYLKNSTTGQCSQCNPLCQTCTGTPTCTSCKPEYNRLLTSNGDCLCFEGYESKDGGALCTKKTNILMVVLSSVGSLVFCIVFWFIGYRCYVMRGRHDQQIYDISAGHMMRNGHAVEICIENDAYLTNGSTPNSFWNSKEYSYKGGQLCSICLDTEPLFMTDCGHYFHAKCIYSWLQSRSVCPNCNKDTDAKELKRWCCKCKLVLMPVIYQVNIRKSKGGRRELVKSEPVEQQICDNCESKPLQGKQLFN